MNDTDTSRLLARLAETFPEQPAPLATIMTAAHQGRYRKRKGTLGVMAATAAVVAVTCSVLGSQMLSTKQESNRSASEPTATRSREALTGEQTTAASRIVEQYMKDEPTSEVQVATATWERGTVEQPNTGKNCVSGHVLQVNLYGNFPSVVTSGPAPDPVAAGQASTSDVKHEADETSGVSEVILTADGNSEEVCLVSVRTGALEPDPDAAVVYKLAD